MGSLRPGEVLADRFEILARAGAGGMGVIYRARDRVDGREVAVKVLEPGRANPERFLREAIALAELRHPAIVAYVAHGSAADGTCYLAMEWLRGEDLSERIARAPLSIADTFALARRIAQALAAAHARHIVHRDVKTANVFLPDGAADLAKLLDFGVARFVDRVSDLTVDNARVGTPAYMSPEQARGARAIDAASDVWSLGVVLYVALTGRRPFAADDAMAVIARVLLADPRPIRELRPDCPGPLVALITRMLAKDPGDRPADGAALVDELARAVAGAGRRRPTEELAVGRGEQRVVTLVLALELGQQARWPEVQAHAQARGARVEPMADGSAAIAFAGGAATDLAGRAARLVLDLRGFAPHTRFAVVTGRAPSPGHVPIVDVIDRAVALLRGRPRADGPTGATQAPSASRSSPFTTRADRPARTSALGGRIAIDPTTAGLLDPRFVVHADEHGLVLDGERVDADDARTVLGQPTPLVGRDAELAALVATWRGTVDEHAARVALIVAPPGVGKSRLRRELIASIGERATVITGRAEVTAAGAAFGVIASAIRHAAHLRDGEPLALQRDKLVARAARHLPVDAAARVAAFLGEIVGVRFSDDEVALRAARGNAALMAEQVRRAWIELLRAECEAGPVVLVAEDLHWADPPSMTYLEAALRELAGLPLLVVATARPEVDDLFARPFAGHALHEVRLRELGARGSERLVRAVLGADTDATTVARVVATGGGNAFYLEELCRAVALGAEGGAPETAVVMVQSRLASLDPGARRVLYAGSVFGETFWAGAVAALFGGATPRAELEHWLDDLVGRELIVRRAVSRIPGEIEYGFRHGLGREAAYGLMAAEDRVVGHRLAGRWLERVGDRDPVRLAEHYERGGALERAAEWHVRAIEVARAGQHIDGVLRHVARAIACGVAGDALGMVRWYEAGARAWRGDMAGAEQAARAALRWLPGDDDRRFGALAELAQATAMLGQVPALRALAAELSPAVAPRSPREAAARAILAAELYLIAQRDLADPLLEGLAGLDPRWLAEDPMLAARCDWARSLRAQFHGDLAAGLAHDQRALAHMERAGALIEATSRRTAVGYTLMALGDFAGAAAALERALVDARRVGGRDMIAAVEHNLGLVRAYQGRAEEGLALEQAAVAAFAGTGARRMEAAALEYVAIIQLVRGEAVAAVAAAERAVAVAATDPPLAASVASSTAVLARAVLACGDAGRACALARRAHAQLVELGGIDDGDAVIRLALVEALRAVASDEAAAAAVAARDHLLARAARIADPQVRQRFVAAVPEHAATMAIAAQLAP